MPPLFNRVVDRTARLYKQHGIQAWMQQSATAHSASMVLPHGPSCRFTAHLARSEGVREPQKAFRRPLSPLSLATSSNSW